MTQDNTDSTAPVVNNGYAQDSIFFAASTVSFYLGRYYDRTVAAGNWPTDAKPTTADMFAIFSTTPPVGMQRGATSGGDPAWVPIPAPSVENAARILNSKVDSALNQFALSWGYNQGIDNATTWSTSSDPQFAAEGKALAAWRDAVWIWVIAQPAGTISTAGMPAAPDRPNVTTGA